jgi:hypothetical protein
MKMKAGKLILLGIILGISPFTCNAQVTIAAGTLLASEGTPDIVIHSVGNISNGSAFDFSAANVHLILSSGDQTLTGNMVVSLLDVVAGLNKNINGTLTVTHGINFTAGFLKPGASGKLLYTGSEDNVNGSSANSFVDGVFTIQSSGRLFFPVGDLGGTGDALYAPAYLETGSSTDEIGLHVIKSNPSLTPDVSETELKEIDNTHYWQISTSNLAAISSRVSLSLNGIAGFSSTLSPVVAESGDVGGTAFSLGSSSSDASFVASRKPFTKSILTIGASEEIHVKIHDIITPFAEDGFNDNLYIESIDKFGLNKVTLLDRWGVPVKEWKNFTNYDDPINPNTDGYDFSKLSPGSYICIVEYGDEGAGSKKISQMITVLKTK